MMTHDSGDYYRYREQAERAAAKEAKSLAARRAHQELAIMYSARTREFDGLSG